MKINNNIHPGEGGYWFRETDGTVIRAPSNWKGVVIRLIRYRRRNKFPPGKPNEEVAAQVCERSPGLCVDHVSPAHADNIRKASLKSRALLWLAHLRGRTDLRWVGPDLAAARAAVCLNCPAHAAVSGGCGSCKRALRGARNEVLGGRAIDERLQGCSVLGEDCGVNTWIDEQTVENPELPACCWRRRS